MFTKDELGREFPDFCDSFESWLLMKERFDREYREKHPPISAMSDAALAALAKELHIKHGELDR